MFKRFDFLTLIFCEIVLFTKLVLKEDVVMLFLVTLSQLIVLLSLMGIKRQFNQKSAIKSSTKILLLLGTAACIFPVLFFHREEFEISRWTEVGLMIRGPYAAVFIVSGIIFVTVSIVASLYYRRRSHDMG